MKYLIVILWSVIYGQVIGYMGSSLVSANYSPMTALIISIVFGIILCTVPSILKPTNSTSEKG